MVPLLLCQGPVGCDPAARVTLVFRQARERDACLAPGKAALSDQQEGVDERVQRLPQRLRGQQQFVSR
jgi:hypothetical protein